MKNLESFIKKNCSNRNRGRFRLEDAIFHCDIDGRYFDETSLKKVIGFVEKVNIIAKYAKVSVCINIDCKWFKDKLSILVLECICYYLVTVREYKVKVNLTSQINIWTEGIKSSPLMLLDSYEQKSVQKYMKRFCFEIYHRHYRRLIKVDDFPLNSLSMFMTEIDSFLNVLGVSEKYRDKVSEVAVELIGNATEHGETDCLIDIDVTNAYKKINSDKLYCGVNVAVINFSEKLVGEAIRKKMMVNENQEGRYKELLSAYIHHKCFFNDKYTQEDFFNIAAFQHKISGREHNISTGGTGLTNLILALEELSDTHICYMVSGDRAIELRKEYIRLNENKWIGFNREGDFLNACPDPEVLINYGLIIPGVAYNLNFAVEKE